MHKNSLANLQKWPKGTSGNPAGRKVGSKNVYTIVRQVLEQDADSDILIGTKIADLTNSKPTNYTPAIVLAMLKKLLRATYKPSAGFLNNRG